MTGGAGWYGVEWVLRLSVLLAVGWVVVRLVARTSTERYTAWRLVLLTVFALPLVAVSVPSLRLPWLPAGPDVRVTVGEGEAVLPDAHAVPEAKFVELSQGSGGGALWTVESALLGVWLAGVILYAGWYVRESVRLRRLVHECRPVAGTSHVAERSRELAARLGYRGKVRVALHDRALAPLTAGVWQPRILLPADAVHWPADRLDMVLCHELVHVQRRDCAVLALAHGLVALLWFHPLAWLLRRELQDECEQSCDEAVVRHGVDPDAYGRALLAFAGAPRGGYVSMGGFARLKKRLEGLAIEPARRARKGGSVAIGSGLVVVLVAVAGVQLVAAGPPEAPQGVVGSAELEGPWVRVETRFVEVPNAAFRSLPIEWNVQMPDFESSFVPHIIAVLAPGRTEGLIEQVASGETADLLAAPTIVVADGILAKIQVTRSFHYPTAYDGAVIERTANGDTTITPQFPKEFEEAEVGVTMEVRPTVGTDGEIDLFLEPKVVQFQGFINYSAGIYVKDAATKKTTLATPNVINQPVFDIRSVQTTVRVLDGHTVVLGGLVSDLSIDAKGQKRISDERQLLVFVTPRIVDGPATMDPSPASAGDPPNGAVLPYGIPAEDKPGFVRSPHAPESGLVDLRGIPSGTPVKCPYTQEVFRVP